MTSPDSSFEATLRATLSQQSRQAPHTDLTLPALARADRIRLRRRITVTVAVAVTAAVAVPVTTSVVDLVRTNQTSSAHHDLRQAQSAVLVDLADLPAGDAPRLPYLSRDSYVDDGQPSPIQPVAGATITDVVRFPDGVGVWSRNLRGIVSFSTNGAPSAIPLGTGSSNPVVDSSGSGQATAWAVHGLGGDKQATGRDTVVYADSLAAEPEQATVGRLEVQHVIGVHEGVVVFDATDGNRSVVGQVGLGARSTGPSQPWPRVEALSAIDSSFSLMAGRTADMTGPERHCTAMLSHDDGAELWHSCAWRPVDFSPDDQRVYAVATTGGAADMSRSAVLDATTGKVLTEFATPGTFGRASFEGNDDVDLVLVQHRKSAIVRCSVTGSCERTTALLPVDRSAPGWLTYPYQLTANP